MLQSVRLKNYRCFDEHEIAFDKLNVVVGANNAGKSTLVEALRLLSLVTNRATSLTYRDPPDWTDLPLRERGVSPSIGDIDLRGGSVFHRYGDPPAIIIAHFSNGCMAKLCVGPNNKIFGVVFDPAGEVIKTKARAASVGIPRIAILPQIGPLLQNEPILSRDHVIRSMSSGLASRHFRNQIHFLDGEHFQDFRNMAEKSWHQLRVNSVSVEEGQSDRFLSLHVRDTDFVAEVGWMGHGLQMWLQIMWFLARSSDAASVILDEPDVYMHADLQRRLIRLLKIEQRQTIVATHSVEIMSEVGPEDIVIVDKMRRKSLAAASLPAVQNIIDQLGGVHNIHLARLWTSRRHLLVEGNDVPLLKAFQDVISPKSDMPLDTIPNVSVGGWSGWQRAVGSAESMKNAAGKDIFTYCIFDSDYHTQDELDERYANADKHGIRLHIWTRKEIENYLLVPSTIARLISQKVPKAGDSPSPDKVERRIDEIADEMKDEVFDALSADFLSRDRKGVTAANRAARKRLSEAWKTQKGKQRIIPGKAMVSRLCEWAQAEYGVSFGTITIARAMRPDEVPQEVQAVIKAIETAGSLDEIRRHFQ